MMPIRCRLVCFVLSAFLFFCAAAPGHAEVNETKAKAFILDDIARTNQLLKAHNLPRHEIADRLRGELRHGFDVLAIAAHVLGPAHARLSENQKMTVYPAFRKAGERVFADGALSKKHKELTALAVAVSQNCFD